MIKQVIKFGIVGVINTLDYYLLYLLFQSVLSIYYLIAHILAFLISMVGSFYLNSYFTYKTKPTLKKFLQFPLTYVVNITVSTSAIYILVDLMKMNEKVSPLLASFIAIPFTFALSRYILTKQEA
ncbi:GtrA family protein [Bacillus sp. BRMEA1]|uniref:GtrA family protein n=1 Tax=Neobacillus endophyticus TaxID=2738405 RepID=UPI001566C5F9|nr:GtrA family protein [Neobacillus endophyticus]NRD76696.1 GtrA family protein [Neobacillus endophyticus]